METTRALRLMVTDLQAIITKEVSADIVLKKTSEAWLDAERELDEIADLWEGVESPETDETVRIGNILDERIKRNRELKAMGRYMKGDKS